MVAWLGTSDALDNIFVGSGFHDHGVLQESVEELASTPGGTPVESKCELIEVTLQMLRTGNAQVNEDRFAQAIGYHLG